MTEGKQHAIRLNAEDMAIVGEIQHRTGIDGVSPAIRYALRQYAMANGIEFRKSTKGK